MKKTFILILALVASAGTVFAGTVASGTCGADGDNLTWTLSTEGVLTISGTGEMADWTTYPDIPWYSNRSSIKSVVIEDGVTSIGEDAFAYCTNLTSVSLPNSVTSMGWCAFTDCTALTSFTISKSVTNIKGGAFLGCTGLTSIIVESGNTKYDSRNNCNAIIETATNTLIQGCKNTIIPYSVTSIGRNAFRDYTNLTSIDIPYSVTSIGYGAFENCSGLTSITCETTEPPVCEGEYCFYGVDKSIPVYVPEGKGKAYGDADGWSEFTNIKDGILASGTCGADGDNLTWKLSETKQLTISGTGAMADYSNTNPWYDNRSSIKSVVIEAGVTSIGKYAFYNCDNLTSVTIPGSVTSIGNYAFNKCSSLASVTIPEGVISIGPRAFQNCTSLTSIELPEGITSIGIRTFYQCTSLKSVTIPAGVTNIYDEAFSGCNALTSITCKATTPPTCASNSFYAVTKSIPVYVPNVDAYTAASGWSSFTNIQSLYVASGTCGKEGDNLKWTLSKEGVLTISGTGEMADWAGFSSLPWTSYYSSIKSVVIEEGVTNIGENAFMNCHGLTKVEISNTVKSIEWCAFADCYALTSFTISKSVTNIKGGAFLECIGLTSIIVESGNTTYDSRDNCNAIIETATNTLIQGCKNTIIPYSVTSIGRHAFRNLSSLTSIVIPAGVKKIENMAFSSCGLTSITCEATEPPICGDDCFNAVDKSIPLYVPKGKVEAYKDPSANGWKDFNNIQEIKCLLASGTCGKNGDNLTWELDCDGTLTISGTGEMVNMGSHTAPWQAYKSIIQSVVIENGVTTIADWAFFDCTAMTSIEIPNSVKSIGWQSISCCKSLTSLSIPGSVEYLEPNAFTYCNALATIEVAENNPIVCVVDGVLFSKDKTLLVQYPCARKGAYVIPNTVTVILNGAFGNSAGLTSVTIPSSVAEIYGGSFINCTGLESITCEATTPPTCYDECFSGVDKTIPLYVPKGKVEAYKDPSANGWKDFNNIQEIGGGTGIEQVTNDQSQMTNGKILRDGQILILRDGKVYTITGQEVR